MSTEWNEAEFQSVKLTMELNLTDIGILLHVIFKQLQKLNSIQEDAHKLDGTTMTNEFTIPMGWPVVKINFVEDDKHRNKPNGVSFEVPGVPVQQLKISNLGPATISYSTNKFLNQLEAASTLVAGETERIKTPKRSIRQLNLVANGGAARVRVEMLM